MFDPSRARIEVVRAGRPELDYALACRQCSRAPCAQACPTEAIRRESGIVVVSEDKCIGCGECVQACPYGSMKIHPARQIAIKCDLCGQCVKYCPPNALKIVDINEVAIEKNNVNARKLADIELNRAEE
jgi:Fe-S-cluster-containing hydrogenase component 2